MTFEGITTIFPLAVFSCAIYVLHTTKFDWDDDSLSCQHFVFKTADPADRWRRFARQLREMDASVELRSMKSNLKSVSTPREPLVPSLQSKRSKVFSGNELLRLWQVIAHRRCSLGAARRLNSPPFVWKTCRRVSLCVFVTLLQR